MKRVLVISISLNLLFLAYVGYRKLRQPDTNITIGIKPLYPDQEAYIKARVESFDQLPIDSGSIIFVGNSITEAFNVQEYFPGLPVKNRGIKLKTMSNEMDLNYTHLSALMSGDEPISKPMKALFWFYFESKGAIK